MPSTSLKDVSASLAAINAAVSVPQTRWSAIHHIHAEFVQNGLILGTLRWACRKLVSQHIYTQQSSSPTARLIYVASRLLSCGNHQMDCWRAAPCCEESIHWELVCAPVNVLLKCFSFPKSQKRLPPEYSTISVFGDSTRYAAHPYGWHDVTMQER